ncbi:protein-disulfide reductase DsbD [Ectothiorhodospiraceae bacterium WFHF3C12]|nr:protein-disulfide reductase DsbD [Ectothiorhodospiraceae bacterium WFHF3C12]
MSANGLRRLVLVFFLCLLPVAGPAQDNSSAVEGGGGGLSLLEQGGNQDDILPVEKAFPFSVELVEPDRIVARWDTREGYYLYKDKIAFRLVGGDNRIVNVQLPAGKMKEDPYFGRLAVYPYPVQAYIELDRPAAGDLMLEADYQGCAEKGICYPPQTVEYPVEGAALAGAGGPGGGGGSGVSLWDYTQADFMGVLQGGSPLMIVAIFFGAGLLLAFTQCIYPMFPILSGIIAGDRHRKTGGRAFLLSLVYVESAALPYALLGTLAGLFSSVAPQVYFQSPWILGGFAALFVVLALGMFDVITIQMPSRWQTRVSEASHHQKRGSLKGAAVMGLLSTLIVGACSGPALVAALAFVSTTNDPLMGGLAFFALSQGMGLPLLLLGTGAGKFLPSAGHWMSTVKHVFGVVFLGVAIYFVDRFAPGYITLALWGVLALGVGVFVGAFDHLALEASRFQRLRKTCGMVLVLWGALSLVGASMGGNDVWQPLQRVAERGDGAGLGATAAAPESASGLFRRVAGLQELEAAMNAARQAGRPVLVDVYADWCVYCVKLDEETFSDPAVRQALERFTLLKVDVTAMNEADKALLERYNVYLPPAVMFFGVNGEEREELRVVGFLEPERFLERVRRVSGDGHSA